MTVPRTVHRIFAIASLLASLPSFANAQLLAPDLPPGSTYHLAFITDATRDATSDRIGDYDSFVNSDVADIGELADIDWRALVSTSTDDATDHVPLSGPVFNLAGDLVANDSKDFWDGRISSPIGTSPSGVFYDNTFVWTGTSSQGSGNDALPLGDDVRATQGRTTRWRAEPSGMPDSGQWTDYGVHDFTRELRFYAVSEPLVVSTPEPSNSAVMLLGAFLVWRRKRERIEELATRTRNSMT